jgi:rsbT co-antagonist protein RsbR
MPVDYMAKLKLDERELTSRRAFFEITEEDLTRLAGLRSLAERHSQSFVEKLYELILGHPESRSFFPDEATIAHVKKMQRQYFLGLFGGRCDLAYVEERLRVGAAHDRVGLAPKWYIGAYARYLRLLFDQMFHELSTADAQVAFRSVSKMVMFDMSLAIVN